MAIVVACYDLFAGSRLIYINDTTVEPWRVLWPIWFIAAGVATAWFAWCALEVDCRHLTAALSWSGSLNVTAYASRAVILALAVLRDHPHVQSEHLQFGVATWMILAFVCAYVWLHVFKQGVEIAKTVVQPPDR